MNFPIVIKYSELDELQYIEDMAELQTFQISLNSFQDTLIDSNGMCFRLNEYAEAVETGKLSLNEFADLIKNHALISGLCCSAKIRISCFTHGIEIVKEA